MANRVVFRRSAEDDLTSIAIYIAGASGFERAYAFVSRIEQRCLALSFFPRVGRDRSDVTRGLRTVSFERRVTIVYVSGVAAVEIVRVLYGGRDLDAELAKLR